MALMMDNKPTEYKGEALVWEKLSSLLPNDVVVYNHREVVDDREFDFALLIKNVGIMVIEVKGWQSQYIFDVKGPDEIVIQGDSKIYGSPEKQARGYRFDWLNLLNDKFAISPVVLSMVCYPFISEKEYKDVRLDIVSSRDFTIFSDDLNSATKLGQKISNAFVKKKPLNSTPFDEKAMAIVRQHFEPSYKAKDDQIVEVSDAYSLLKVFNKELTEKDSDELIEMYFAGTKIVAFVKSEIDLLSVCNKLEAGFNARGIISDKGNVRLAEIDERNDFSGASGSYRIFNFEIYTHNLDLNNDEIIVEGQYTEQQKLILEDVANSTSWNLDQYKVEHAMGDKNVLVQAGAGTGKTYSMVSRIAYLCISRKRFVNNLVDEIAMVTFTNEAADNMKLRLKQYFMNCYILTKNKKVLHEIEAVDLMQISTIHKFAKTVLQSSAMEYGLGADFAISSSEYAKEQIYEKYLNDFLVEKQKEDANFAQQLRMPVHKFRKLLMHFSQQLYNKSYGIKELKAENLGTFEEWPFFNDVIMKVMIPAEKEYEEQIFSKNKIDLKESMLLLNDAVNGAFKEKCSLKYKYLFIDEFQDTDDVQIDSFLKLQNVIKDTTCTAFALEADFDWRGIVYTWNLYPNEQLLLENGIPLTAIRQYKGYVSADQVMETKSAQYQKVPLNWFIYSVKDKSNNMNILMKDFMTITANLYIYSFLFTLSPSKKSKKNIDHSLYNVLNEDVDIKQIINIVKELRKKQVENVQIPENCRSFDVLSNLYTIMDCFKVKENRFDVTYHNHGGQLYTLEHFIVPDNRNAKIKWLTKDEESIEISFTGQSERKKKLINYLIVEQKLNNDILLDFDVIKKIELISDYYGNATPKHVGIITAHIENMESYKELKKLKNEEDEKEVENIRNCYNSFLDEYFSDNNQRTILNKLLEGLKLTFINS